MSNTNIKLANYNTSWRQYHFQASSELQLAALEKDFSHFLSPHPLVQTSGRSPNQPLLGVIARWQGKIVGLLVVEKHDCQNGLIICWNVTKSQRGFRLGQQLFKQMEVFALSNGVSNLTLSFRWDSTFRQQITKTLHRLNWQTPKKELVLYKFSPERFMKMAWCQQISLPEEFEMFPWNKLTNHDKQHILNRQQQENWYPLALSPLFEGPTFESANSVGLRLHGKVVGWMITHQVKYDVIEYSSLFVSPELQKLGRGVHLIVESVKCQQLLGVAKGIFQVQAENKAMITFAEERMRETILSQTSRWFSKKLLA